jgi:general secretion pathway protein K
MRRLIPKNIRVRENRFSGNDRGIALIMVLWVIVLLGVTATYFSRGIREEAYIVKTFKENEKANLLATAGVHHALALLSHPYRDRMNVDQDYIDHYFTDIDTVAFAEGTYSVRVNDEESKININLASREVIRGLLTNIGLYSMKADSISDAIMDWRDADDAAMLNGAESDYYMGLDNPYPCKNSTFHSLEELLLVRGVTPEILYGENQVEGGDGLIDHLTIYGRGKVNINTANENILRSLPGVDDQSSSFIVRGRDAIDYTPLTKHTFIQYLQEVNPGEDENVSYQELQRLIDTKSYHFTILSRGKLDGESIEKWLKVIVYKTIMGSKVSLRILSWREIDQGVIASR